MRRTRFTETQIVSILKEAEGDAPLAGALAIAGTGSATLWWVWPRPALRRADVGQQWVRA